MNETVCSQPDSGLSSRGVLDNTSTLSVGSGAAEVVIDVLGQEQKRARIGQITQEYAPFLLEALIQARVSQLVIPRPLNEKSMVWLGGDFDNQYDFNFLERMKKDPRLGQYYRDFYCVDGKPCVARIGLYGAPLFILFRLSDMQDFRKLVGALIRCRVLFDTERLDRQFDFSMTEPVLAA